MTDKSLENKNSKDIKEKSTGGKEKVENESTLSVKVKDKKSSFKQNKDVIANEILEDLIAKKTLLDQEIASLKSKKDNLNKEIESTFNGQSENIAKRVKGFQEYLTGALQNLSQSVEKLDLVSQPLVVKPSPLDEIPVKTSTSELHNIPAIADTFKPDEEIIRKCFSKFCDQPDFYADPWKLRRSLDNKGVEILEDWFFNMGGRGAIESRGTRQKNALLSAALISVLGELYGDQFQTLILASEPERLGEWRRILQDSLGLTRDDFGPSSGIALFERAEGVIERADRLEANQEVPLIIVDASESSVEIPILQFPLWLAFAGTPEEIYDEYNYN